MNSNCKKSAQHKRSTYARLAALNRSNLDRLTPCAAVSRAPSDKRFQQRMIRKVYSLQAEPIAHTRPWKLGAGPAPTTRHDSGRPACASGPCLRTPGPDAGHNASGEAHRFRSVSGPAGAGRLRDHVCLLRVLSESPDAGLNGPDFPIIHMHIINSCGRPGGVDQSARRTRWTIDHRP